MSDAEDTNKKSLAQIVLAIVGDIQTRLSPGDVAELRRMRPGVFEPPAFWRIAAVRLEGELAPLGPVRRAERERRWALTIAAMARSGSPHGSTRSLGGALAAAGVTELRITRLLRAEGEQLAPQVFSMVQILAAKGEHVNWIDLAHLVLSEGRRDADDRRRHIARQYYATTA